MGKRVARGLKHIAVWVAVFPVLPVHVFRMLVGSWRHPGAGPPFGAYGRGQKRYAAAKGIAAVVVLVILVPVWVAGYFLFGTALNRALGYIPEVISVSGTGSMHPTFPKGDSTNPKELAGQVVATPGMLPYPNGFVIGGKRYFGHVVARGDIAAMDSDAIRSLNAETYGEPAGWVKRIIGLPGDIIELREGLVYIHGEPIREPYTAKPRSTFGEAFLVDCSRVTVPEGMVFVMGDNRKASSDSRQIGFIDIGAIHHVLPLEMQKGVWDRAWRDTSRDTEPASKITLDAERYVALLNDKRRELGVEVLTHQQKLTLSAQKRGEHIIATNDFSFEATRSGYTMAKAWAEVGYGNITSGEAQTQGYFEAEELLENEFQFPDSRKFLLDKDFEDIGIAAVEGEINGCPTQVIVQHFAGYVPPNYKKQDIATWKQNLANIRDVAPGWAALRTAEPFYQNNKADIDRINDIISLRIANFERIIARMEANQWFTAEEKNILEGDQELYEEQQAIAQRINGIER